MMETKLWIALCALLAIHLGSPTRGDDHTAAPPSKTIPNAVQATGAPVQDHAVTSGLHATSHSGSSPEINTGFNGTDSVNSSTTTGFPITAEPRKDDVTDKNIKAKLSIKQKVTDKALSPSQSNPTIPVPTNTSTAHVTHTSVGKSVTLTPSSNQNTSSHQNQTEAPPAITAPTKPKSSNPAVTTKSWTASNTSSPFLPKTSTLQPSRQSIAQTNSQTSTHANNPSRLNVKGDTHTSPGLDPLLAGLVSAFIIAAVIITLLLFLKLRRRGNGPEFRRLQDLPMDDMEDTPLSMYSY